MFIKDKPVKVHPRDIDAYVQDYQDPFLQLSILNGEIAQIRLEGGDPEKPLLRMAGLCVRMFLYPKYTGAILHGDIMAVLKSARTRQMYGSPGFIYLTATIGQYQRVNTRGTSTRGVLDVLKAVLSILEIN